ncbi:MAG TPA: TetR/AcrR family transcriptional regulator [Roseiarcus sp.]|nr:TetR/AcrR family transcriptional regulator [Roseiarcus sp.]
MIDDVIAAAGVSRGTFYNYFRTNAELLVAAIEELGNELVDMIESRVEASPSPAERLFTGFRLYLEAARRFPLFARFIARVGPQAIGPDNLVYKYIPIHIAQESKRVNSSTLR